ncbi:MAG: FkbM family methyltransferase [Candidatus Colwellbacteria bacterium]|nr:FkbM family methyltransferase [Candidatus Colwellbacteria bacterium]
MIISALVHANKRYNAYYKGGILTEIKRLLRYPVKYVCRGLAVKFGLFGKKPVSTHTCWGGELFILLPDKNAGSLYYFGLLPKQEYPLSLYLAKTLKSSDIFYDVGANYGFYSALAKALVRDGEIHAFEPHPLLTECLNKSFPSGVFINQAALADKVGEITLYDKYVNGHSGGSTILEGVGEISANRSHALKISAISLDDYVKTRRPPTIVKIDVEGAESLVIRGGAQTLKKHKPVVIMEVWGKDLWNKYSRSAAGMLFEFGYSANEISSEGELLPVSKRDLERISLGRKYANVVFS